MPLGKHKTAVLHLYQRVRPIEFTCTDATKCRCCAWSYNSFDKGELKTGFSLRLKLMLNDAKRRPALVLSQNSAIIPTKVLSEAHFGTTKHLLNSISSDLILVLPGQVRLGPVSPCPTSFVLAKHICCWTRSHQKSVQYVWHPKWNTIRITCQWIQPIGICVNWSTFLKLCTMD